MVDDWIGYGGLGRRRRRRQGWHYLIQARRWMVRWRILEKGRLAGERGNVLGAVLHLLKGQTKEPGDV